jgi:hypothetical protein
MRVRAQFIIRGQPIPRQFAHRIAAQCGGVVAVLVSGSNNQPTISRSENLPDVRALLRLGRTLIEQYCARSGRWPRRITLDIDDTPAYAGGRLF